MFKAAEFLLNCMGYPYQIIADNLIEIRFYLFTNPGQISKLDVFNMFSLF